MKGARAKSRAAPAALDWRASSEPLLSAALLALFAIAPLVSTDTPADLGIFAVQAILWMTLTAAALAWLVLGTGRSSLKLDAIDGLAALFLAATLASTLLVAGVGDLRSAINALFQTAAFVAAIVLARRLFAARQRRREALAVLLSVALALALFALLEYFVLDPLAHARIRANPAELLRLLNIPDLDSPEAKPALDRFFSPEPLTTFALTNSLASFMIPWIILLAAALWTAWTSRVDRGVVAGGAAALLAMSVCLLLTKSRTAVLASAAGLGVLAAARLGLGQRLPGRWLAFAAGGTALVVGGVWLAGGLDPKVFSEAPVSVLYRLQYWQSTAAMIRDHFLFGVGPGNFKSVYTHYKLPEASEEIGDPHNFLFEIGSTAGMPALLFLLGMLGMILRRPVRKEFAEPAATKSGNPYWLLGGALCGLLLAIPINGFFGGGTNQLGGIPVVLLVGLPTLLAGWFLFRPLLTDELLSGPALPVAVIALLINLLAAGGIGFPNVNLPLALLLACCAPSPAEGAWGITGLRTPSRIPGYLTLAASVALLLGCFLTFYWPVIRADQLADAGDPVAAMRADPWNPRICLDAARSAADWETAEQTMQEGIRRDGRSHVLRAAAAEFYLAAYRRWNRGDHLEQAVEHFAAAVERYPNFSVLHARLAWAQSVAGKDSAAEASAREALRLDALCPHDNKRLTKYRLTDPGMSAGLRELPLDELMRKLADGEP